jgi:S-DNA-T family DNA segregation ATPase FtsK/SpoIIIE
VNGGLDTDGEADPVYDQAVEVVLKNRRASISLVQRHLRIGYNRSARLIEAMEKAGWFLPWMPVAVAKSSPARKRND